VRDRLTRLFLRYRDQRDGRALGRLFDRVAPRLLGVAAHLAPDLASAEDLVQATFLVALERARSFDPAREVEPWLYGILVREAARARRRRAQVPDARRVAREDVEPAPDVQLEGRELQALVTEALDRLPARYREVLAPYLCEGLSAVEIARRLERTPPLSAGHVRVLIGRGLERLRRHLPAGVALGAAGTLFVPRGHAALRAELLERAGLSRAELAGASPALGSVPLALGGLVVTKSTLLLGAAGAALIALLGLGLLRSVPSAGDAFELEAPLRSRPSDLELAARSDLSTMAAETTRNVAAAPDPTPEAEVPAPAAPPARVGGRVVDEADEPVPFATLRSVDRPAWTARCDASGSFALLDEACPEFIGAFHPDHAPSLALPRRPGEALLLVMGGPAAGLDVLVADESGEPVGGAEVAVGRQDSERVLTADGREARPPLAERTSTDPSGRASLRGLPSGSQSIRVVAPGFVEVATSFPLVAGESRELPLVLRRGMRLVGRVTASDGSPLAGVSISVGEVGRSKASTQTDVEGGYVLDGIPNGDTRRAVASVQGYERAEYVLQPAWEQRWDPVLESLGTIEGRVVDERGAPLEGWWVLLHYDALGNVPVSERGGGLHWWMAATQADREGRFVLEEVPAQPFRLSVRTPALWDGGAVLVVDDARAGEKDRVLRVPDSARPSAVLRGSVRDGPDTWPSAAEVSLRREGDSISFPHALDERGAFELGSLLPGRYELSVVPDGRFVALTVPCEVRAGETTELGTLAVPRCGRLRVRLSCPDVPMRGEASLRIARIEAGRVPTSRPFAPPFPEELELSAGEYEVSLRCSHYLCEPVRVWIRPDGVETVDLTLEPATLAELRFVVHDGPPLEGEIELLVQHNPSGVELARHTGHAGMPLILDLEPGYYSLCATAKDGRAGRLGGWFGIPRPSPFEIVLGPVPDGGKQR